MIGGFKQVAAAEGPGALLTGLMPTAQGYFIQGWFKFGGVEFFKINITNAIGDEAAWNNRQKIYLASSAMAEFIADIFLCPYEACRIRLVSDPTYASGMAACASRMSAEMGFVGAFYSGFVPILSNRSRTPWPSSLSRARPPRPFTGGLARNLRACPRAATSAFPSGPASLLASSPPSSRTLRTRSSPKSTRLAPVVRVR